MSAEWRPVVFPYRDGGDRRWGVYCPSQGWLHGAVGQFLMFTKEGAERRADELNAASPGEET